MRACKRKGGASQDLFLTHFELFCPSVIRPFVSCMAKPKLSWDPLAMVTRINFRSLPIPCVGLNGIACELRHTSPKIPLRRICQNDADTRKESIFKKLSDKRILGLRKNTRSSAVITMRKWHAQETVHASHFSVHHIVFC
jgi:hypothetical protein